MKSHRTVWFGSLPDAARECYQAIVQYIQIHGITPTVSALAKSLSAPASRVRASIELLESVYLIKRHDGEHRGIQLISPDGAVCPCCGGRGILPNFLPLRCSMPVGMREKPKPRKPGRQPVSDSAQRDIKQFWEEHPNLSARKAQDIFEKTLRYRIHYSTLMRYKPPHLRKKTQPIPRLDRVVSRGGAKPTNLSNDEAKPKNLGGRLPIADHIRQAIERFWVEHPDATQREACRMFVQQTGWKVHAVTMWRYRPEDLPMRQRSGRRFLKSHIQLLEQIWNEFPQEFPTGIARLFTERTGLIVSPKTARRYMPIFGSDGERL
jgi:hypothetical protein